MNHFSKKRISLTEVTALKKAFRRESLHTVCESARCPNIGECFGRKTATFLIAGDVCTRKCSFCAVPKGLPCPPDGNEPERVAHMVVRLGLRYVVVTSVTRDDLPDGGAGHFLKAVAEIRRAAPRTRVEILVPDFNGDDASLAVAFSSAPDVFAHNLETVPRLYPVARQGADYERSLNVLARAKSKGLTTKSGLMLGLGERPEEVLDVMRDLRRVSCDILTLGQYLSPSKYNLPVREQVPLEQFERYAGLALELGFQHCSSAPYVRSSYLAGTMVDSARQQ